MVLEIRGRVDFPTLGELKRYITDVLGIPTGCLKFITPNGGTAQNETDAESFFVNNWDADVSNAEGFTYHAADTITVSTLKENISRRLCIPQEAIRICWSDNVDVPGMTQVVTLRTNW